MLANARSGHAPDSLTQRTFFGRFWVEKDLMEVERRLSTGELNKDQAAKLREFARKGFFRSKLPEVTDELFAQIARDIERIWNEKPIDLGYVFLRQAQSMADSNQRRERMAPYKLLDPHSHSDALCRIYLDPHLFDWMRLIMGEEPVAFHSRFAEFGRSELPVRDSYPST